MAEAEWEKWAKENEASDEQRQRELEKARILHAAVGKLAAHPDGRFFLRWLIDETGALRQEFPRDDRVAMWNAGRRAFGLQVLGLCAAHGVADILMEKESANGRTA